MPNPLPEPCYQSCRRWTEKEAREALSALATSGLSVSVFAARAGLDIQRLYHWRRRLKESRAREVIGAPTFVELHPLAAERRLEIVLPRSGIVIRVGESIEGATLQHLVEALERSSC
jgi:transposase-like protein